MTQEGKRILGFVPDLFFSTKIRDTARYLGHSATIARTTDDLIQKAKELSPTLIIVDLTAEGMNLDESLTRLRGEAMAASVPLLAFTTHAAWKQTTPLHHLCTQVVTKEVFARELPTLLQKYLSAEPR